MATKGLYRIPPEDVLKQTIREVLEDYGMVGSLRALTSLVNMRLKSENPAWRAGSRRIKRAAASTRGIKMEIISSERGDIVGEPTCIVCGSKMRPVMNRTLYGDIVTLGYSCPECGYRTGMKRMVPSRYMFRVR